ncbi:MAG: hypothetical protein JSS90_06800 [Bacteroidetes bacterium]|jgi:hypothetical protein|nr:hypothetical protein [Bacteroidota bacterium]
MSEESLRHFGENEKYIRQTVQQLNKDLIGTGCTIMWNGDVNTAQQELISHLMEIITSLRKTPGTFNAWIYRVDIPEKSMRRILHQNDELLAMAHAILERTFIKIMFRNSGL